MWHLRSIYGEVRHMPSKTPTARLIPLGSCPLNKVKTLVARLRTEQKRELTGDWNRSFPGSDLRIDSLPSIRSECFDCEGCNKHRRQSKLQEKNCQNMPEAYSDQVQAFHKAVVSALACAECKSDGREPLRSLAQVYDTKGC